jgi:hypothetical protein
MTNEDIIRMARESGLVMYDYSDPSLERFANLVAAAERNRTWTQDHWTEYERSIVAAEREAVLQAIEAVYTLEEDRNPMFSDGYKYALDQIETLIRAREQS